MTYDGPLTGTVLETDVHHAFVLDGPAAGQWVTWPDHYQVVEFTERSQWWRDAVMDEVVVTKTTTYHLERFAIQSLDSKRRMWKFFASVPGDQIDPSVPLFMLIDAEPSRVKLCEVSR